MFYTIGDLECYMKDNDLNIMIDYENELFEHPYSYILNLDKKELEIYWYERKVKSYRIRGNKIQKKWIGECESIVEKYYEEEIGGNTNER